MNLLITQRSIDRTSDLIRPFVPKAELNSSLIEHFVSGLRYPATKEEIINQAEANCAPQNIMAFYVYRLPERMYRSPSDISFTAFASAYFFGQD